MPLYHFDLVNWWLGAMPVSVLATGKREFYTPEMARRLIRLLKSTYSLSMIPETCDPTFTLTIAETSPVALTTSLTGPRVTVSVR